MFHNERDTEGIHLNEWKSEMPITIPNVRKFGPVLNDRCSIESYFMHIVRIKSTIFKVPEKLRKKNFDRSAQVSIIIRLPHKKYPKRCIRASVVEKNKKDHNKIIVYECGER